MHLDTYFNVISKNKVVLVENRLNIASEDNSKMRLFADVYHRNSNGSYVLVTENIDFVEFLKENGFQIIPVSLEDQLNYGVNFLTIEEN